MQGVLRSSSCRQDGCLVWPCAHRARGPSHELRSAVEHGFSGRVDLRKIIFQPSGRQPVPITCSSPILSPALTPKPDGPHGSSELCPRPRPRPPPPPGPFLNSLMPAKECPRSSIEAPVRCFPRERKGWRLFGCGQVGLAPLSVTVPGVGLGMQQALNKCPSAEQA